MTRLNETELVLNADLRECVEPTPDTIIALTTGKKIMVREATDIDRVTVYKQQAGARPEWAGDWLQRDGN